MREIEFRGMHTHMFSCNEHLDGTWVYGYLVDENYINDKRDLGDGEYLGEMLIDPETVGQFTGLLDKNGTKIFEGDILIKPSYLINTYDYRNVCVCKRVERGGVIGLALCDKDVSGEYDNVISSDEWEDFEVIGNIHENPELLEVEK